MISILNNIPTYDTVGVNERVSRYCTRSIKKSSKTEGLKLALSMIDLTTLEGKDTKGKVQQLCYKAMHPHDTLTNIPTVAAICVYPTGKTKFVGPRKVCSRYYREKVFTYHFNL